SIVLMSFEKKPMTFHSFPGAAAISFVATALLIGNVQRGQGFPRGLHDPHARKPCVRPWNSEQNASSKPASTSARESAPHANHPLASARANACRREQAMQARLSGRSSLTSPSRAGAGQRGRRGHPAARKSPLSVAWLLRTSSGGRVRPHARRGRSVLFLALCVFCRNLFP